MVHGVTKSWTRLKPLSTHTHYARRENGWKNPILTRSVSSKKLEESHPYQYLLCARRFPTITWQTNILNRVLQTRK